MHHTPTRNFQTEFHKNNMYTIYVSMYTYESQQYGTNPKQLNPHGPANNQSTIALQTQALPDHSRRKSRKRTPNCQPDGRRELYIKIHNKNRKQKI